MGNVFNYKNNLFFFKIILMEINQKENIPQFSLKSKSQIHFGLDFSNKISELKIFIYGLRGVSYYEFNNINI